MKIQLSFIILRKISENSVGIKYFLGYHAAYDFFPFEDQKMDLFAPQGAKNALLDLLVDKKYILVIPSKI